MSIPMQLLLVIAAFCVCLSEGAPDGRIARAKQQRPTRGFKNLEMMTARGFGKRGRPSTRTERDVQHQLASERAYRAAPTFKSPSVNFGGGFGKRMPEIEPEGDSEDENLPERASRNLPTFRSPSMSFGSGYGKRRPEMDPEGNMEDQSLLERINRAPPTFTPPKVIFGRGVGKRVQEMELEETHRRFNPKSSMMVATDFGKRSADENAEEADKLKEPREFKPTRSASGPNFAIGYGKRKLPTKRVYGLDNFWEMLPGSPEREGQEMEEDKLESIPMDWFVNEIVNNPDFARSVVRKFIDINQDGMLSSDELLRNV